VPVIQPESHPAITNNADADMMQPNAISIRVSTFDTRIPTTGIMHMITAPVIDLRIAEDRNFAMPPRRVFPGICTVFGRLLIPALASILRLYANLRNGAVTGGR